MGYVTLTIYRRMFLILNIFLKIYVTKEPPMRLLIKILILRSSNFCELSVLNLYL